MQTVYMVTKGTYDGYQVIRVFEVKQVADEYTVKYNNDVIWMHEDDKARVEEIEFVPVRQAKAIDYKVVG